MTSKKQIRKIFCVVLSIFQTLSAQSEDWIATTDSDLNTASNWYGNAVPTLTAYFSSIFPNNVNLTPTANALFTIGEINFVDEASPYAFTFTGPGALKFTGTGILGAKTNASFSFLNTTAMGNAQLFFAPDQFTFNTSLGNANLTFYNNVGGTISYVNAAQLAFGDTDAGAVVPISAGDNVQYYLQNRDAITGSNEAAQVFMKGSSFTVGTNFSFTAKNLNESGNSGNIQGVSDTGQIVVDAGGGTASWTTGDNATFNLFNGSIGSNNSITSSHNNAGQIIFDGKDGAAAFTVGKNANFSLIHQNNSAISNTSTGNDCGQMIFDGNNGTASFAAGDNAVINLSIATGSLLQGLGFDTAQLVIDGDGGTASFTLGNACSMALINSSGTSNAIVTGGDGNDAGQMIIDGNNGTASFSTGKLASIYVINTNNSSIVAESGPDAHDAGQIVVDGNRNTSPTTGTASFALGDNSFLYVLNDTGCGITSTFNTGQFVVDGHLGKASVTLGNDTVVDVQNNGDITNTLDGSVAAQIAFYGCDAQTGSVFLNTGTNTSLTASLGTSGTISNCGAKPAAQFYFNNTIISGNPTLTAINQSATPVEGIVFDGSSNAGFSNIALQNSSLLINTASHPLFTIGSLSGDAASVVKLNQDLDIHTPFGAVATFSGVILDQSGVNNLIMSGPGTQVLSGANTFGGNTSVNGGILILNGSVLHSVDVNAGGTLAGIGTVNGSVAVNQDGVIIPGFNPGIGTFHINQNYTQAAGGIFQEFISGSTDASGVPLSSLLAVGGTASVAGTLEVVSVDGTYSIGRPYTILTAVEALNGSFDQVKALTPFLNFDVIYHRDPSIELILSTNFESGARTSNQLHVAEQIDGNTFPIGNQEAVINNLLALSPRGLRNALDEMAGEQYAYLAQINQYADYRFGHRLFDAVRNFLDPCSCNCCCSTNSWIAFEYEYGQLSNAKIARGYKQRSEDISIGIENNCGCFLYGTALNLETNHISFNLQGTNTLYNIQGALYGAYQDRRCNYYLFSDLIVGEGFSDFKRPIHFGNQYQSAHSKPKFTHGQIYAETGLNYCWCNILLQPFVGGDCNYVKAHCFHEKHAKSLNLNVKNRSIWSENIYLGTHLTSSVGSIGCLECLGGLSFNADLVYQHRFGSLGTTLHNKFSQFGNTFEVKGADYGRNGFIGNISAVAKVMQLVDCYVEFTSEYWDSRYTLGGSIGFNYCW